MKNNIAESRFNRIYRFRRYTLYKVMQHDVLVSKAITKLLSDWTEMRAGTSTWLYHQRFRPYLFQIQSRPTLLTFQF